MLSHPQRLKFLIFGEEVKTNPAPREPAGDYPLKPLSKEEEVYPVAPVAF